MFALSFEEGISSSSVRGGSGRKEEERKKKAASLSLFLAVDRVDFQWIRIRTKITLNDRLHHHRVRRRIESVRRRRRRNEHRPKTIHQWISLLSPSRCQKRGGRSIMQGSIFLIVPPPLRFLLSSWLYFGMRCSKSKTSSKSILSATRF